MTSMWMSSTFWVMAAMLTQPRRGSAVVELLEDIRLDRLALALQRDGAERRDPRARQAAQRSGADRDGADRRRPLQPRRDVHRVADHRVALALARADDADHRLAAVDADAEPRPVGMRAGVGGARREDVERGAGRPPRVVGLVAAGVERRDDRVADEAVDLAAVGADGRDRALERRVEHLRDLDGVAAVGERREAGEVGEDD